MEWAFESYPEQLRQRQEQIAREWEEAVRTSEPGPATVVLAFDSDEAGEKATINAILNLLSASATERNYLRASWEGAPYEDAIRYLSNEELFAEYQANKASESAWIDDESEMGRAWYQMVREAREACMLLITERAQEASEYKSSRQNNAAGRFNAEQTITSVLAMFDIQAVPGRNIKCPAHEDSSPSCTVFKHDHRIYCHAAHCVLNGGGRGEDAYGLYRILSEIKK